MGQQVLTCVPAQDPSFQNPPCPTGSALVLVDPGTFVPDPWVGAVEAAVISFGLIVSAFFVGLTPSVIRRI